MADYKQLFKTTDNQNWLKVAVAIHITKTGLTDFVTDVAVQLRDKITNDIQQGTNLPAGTRCNKCNTCPEANCEKFRQMIKTYHRFHGPSWRNTNPNDWCMKPWEVAKCFFPGDGYRDKLNAQETDFNGIVGFILNSTTFDGQTGENLSDIKGNKFYKCRQLVNIVRHSATLEVKDADRKDYITQLKNLLTSGAVLQNNTKANDAHGQLTSLENDKLTITTDDIVKVIEDTLEETKQLISKANEVNKEASNINANTRDLQTKLETLTRALEDNEKQKQDAIKEFCGDLKTFYRQRHQTMPISPLMPTVDDEFGKLYVTPQLTYISRKKENSMPLLGGVTETGEQVTTYSGILYRDGRKARNVYIQGEPGTGKSTFCVHLVSAWCESQTTSSSQCEHASSSPVERQTNPDSSQGGDGSPSPVERQNSVHISQGGVDSPSPVDRKPKVSNNADTEHFADDHVLQEFDFLFLVTLRNASEHECDIEDMIRNQIISEIASHRQYDDAFVARILDEEKCLIIMDGLDEWSHPDSKTNTCPRNPKSIPHRKIWKNCSYLTTTRPWKMNVIGIKDSDIDSQISLYGLESPQSMTQKVIDCLNDKFGKSRDPSEFEHQLKNKRLQHMFQIPILLMQLICVWFEDQTLGNSKCEIYSNMIDMMFKRAHKTFRTVVPSYNLSSSVELPHCFKETNWCKQYRHFLKSLSELAFNTLLSHDRESTIVFGEAILVQYLSKDEQHLAFKTGIISEHKPMVSLTRSRNTYYFLHKTFQEFLAALYISLNPSPRILQQVFKVYGRKVEVLDISAIFVFVCGMNSHLATKMSVQITKVFNENHDERVYDYDDLVFSVYQNMLLDGYSQDINNGHKNTNLEFQHSVIDHSNLSISDRTNLKCLLDMNAGKLLTYLAKNNVPIEDIKEEISRNNRLTMVTLVNRSSSGHDTLDLSRHRDLVVLFLFGVKGLNINVNKNLTHCVIGRVSRELETSILTKLLHRASRLESLLVTKCNNIGLLLRVLSSAPKLQYVFIKETILRYNDIILTNSVNDVHLVEVSMSSRSCRTLVDSMTRIPHSVECKLEECTVTPVEEFDTLRKYISESDLFVVTENNDDTFEFETIPRINKNKKRCVIN